jgi:serine/threonine protein kinase
MMHGQCIIVDFGLSKNTRSSVGTETASQALKPGTPIYSAPEVTAGSEDATPASDVFSLGVIFYEAVSGHLPFGVSADLIQRQGRSKLANFTSELQLSIYQMNKVYTPPCPLSAKEVPRPLNDFVVKCLSNKPETRWRSASEMLEPWENAKEKADKEKEEKAEQSQANIFWTKNFPGEMVDLETFKQIFCKTYGLSEDAWANFSADIDEDGNGHADQYEFLNMLAKHACESMEEVVQKYNSAAQQKMEEASVLEPANVYFSKHDKAKRLICTDVQFQSKGTFLGGKKERVGNLTLQHGCIKVHRVEGKKSILEFEFEVAHSSLGREKGKAEITFLSIKATASRDADKGKPRKFTFKTLEDCDALQSAFEATKTWMNQ